MKNSQKILTAIATLMLGLQMSSAAHAISVSCTQTAVSNNFCITESLHTRLLVQKPTLTIQAQASSGRGYVNLQKGTANTIVWQKYFTGTDTSKSTFTGQANTEYRVFVESFGTGQRSVSATLSR